MARVKIQVDSSSYATDNNWNTIANKVKLQDGFGWEWHGTKVWWGLWWFVGLDELFIQYAGTDGKMAKLSFIKVL